MHDELLEIEIQKSPMWEINNPRINRLLRAVLDLVYYSKNIETLTLIQELLKRETEDGTKLFREATITARDGRTQILGLIASLEMKLDRKDI